MSVKASELNAAIKRKYSGSEWRVWFEVSESTGAYSGRRADAVVMNIWPSKKYQMHVFEVKVSRSDFKSEMQNMGKSDAIGKYADFFWLACPVGLVQASEVPEAWGLMELTKSGLRIKKQAPARAEPVEFDRGFVASILRSGEDLTESDIAKQVSERVEAGRAEIKEAAEMRLESEITRQKMRADKLEKWRSEFYECFGARVNIHSLPSDMADRITLASKIEVREFDLIAAQARGLADLIDRIKDNEVADEQ